MRKKAFVSHSIGSEENDVDLSRVHSLTVIVHIGSLTFKTDNANSMSVPPRVSSPFAFGDLVDSDMVRGVVKLSNNRLWEGE